MGLVVFVVIRSLMKKVVIFILAPLFTDLLPKSKVEKKTSLGYVIGAYANSLI